MEKLVASSFYGGVLDNHGAAERGDTCASGASEPHVATGARIEMYTSQSLRLNIMLPAFTVLPLSLLRLRLYRL